MKEEPTINYAFALKHYNQNGRGRSMKKFCEEEGYDYEKFMQYSRRQHRKWEIRQAQRVHVLCDQELQDDEA